MRGEAISALSRSRDVELALLHVAHAQRKTISAIQISSVSRLLLSVWSFTSSVVRYCVPHLADICSIIGTEASSGNFNTSISR